MNETERNENEFVTKLAALRVRILREGLEVESPDTTYRVLAKREGRTFANTDALIAKADALARAVVDDDPTDDAGLRRVRRFLADQEREAEPVPAPAPASEPKVEPQFPPKSEPKKESPKAEVKKAPASKATPKPALKAEAKPEKAPESSPKTEWFDATPSRRDTPAKAPESKSAPTASTPRDMAKANEPVKAPASEPKRFGASPTLRGEQTPKPAEKKKA